MHDRIFQADDQSWYYRTRGNHIGPFNSRQEAELKLRKQMRSWTGRAGPLASWHRNWQPTRIFRRSATRQG
jgi:hypothetical protein